EHSVHINFQIELGTKRVPPNPVIVVRPWPQIDRAEHVVARLKSICRPLETRTVRLTLHFDFTIEVDFLYIKNVLHIAVCQIERTWLTDHISEFHGFDRVL